MRHSRIIAMCLGCAVAISMLTGCVAEKPHEPETFGYQPNMLPHHVAPAQMDDLAGMLMRYRAAHGRLPVNLADMVEAEVMTADQLAALPAYGYSGRGLGRLQDGRLVVLVDSAIRIPNQAWCIVQKPTAANEPAVLETSLVSMAQLRAAAARAAQ